MPMISMLRIQITAFLLSGLFLSASLAAPPSGQGYKIVFADEFGGTAVDTMKWNIASPGWTMPNSLSIATASKVSVTGGELVMNATRTATSGTTQFQSGSVSTYQKYNWDGGYFEARIKLPSKPGSWPAFWGLYTGWPPEMDIMEYPLSAVSGSGYANDTYHTAFHYTNTSGTNSAGAGSVDTGIDLRNSYHTFAAEWVSDSRVDFYFDGVLKRSFTQAAEVAEMQNMYLILDYAVGGWPGTPTTAQWALGDSDQTVVDYVRVYQKATDLSTAAWQGTGTTGSWDTTTNWSTGVPKFQDKAASFNTNGQTAATVTWNLSRTVGGLSFAGSTGYTIGDADAGLQLANSGGTAAINVDAAATADQTIAARLEAYSNVVVANNSARTLSLTGVITGEGDLTFDGPGTVRISNNNTYTGDTYIDSGTQGAAVVRVDRSRPFGSTGIVYFNPAGNATSGRIEILGNRTVPNAVILSGRTNTSVAIQNIADNNAFTGTISANVGGSNYILQSDAGRLELSGADAAAGGIALRAAATGNRTFTLQGAGNGLISGQVVNGNGIVGLIKTGLGTWTLSAVNTYTGNTTINAGTLELADNAALAFLIGASGVNNRVTGTGTLLLAGDFNLNLTSAGTMFGDSWQLVDNALLTETYSSTFTLPGFTPDTSGLLWSKPIDSAKAYQFSEVTGALTVVPIPEPALFAVLAVVGFCFLCRR
jgi:autotransporter-associated beta strand protein